MPTIEIKRHQTLLDFSVQHTGSIEGWLTIAIENKTELTDDIPGGTMLIVNEVIDLKVSSFFTNSGNTISSNKDSKSEATKEGIGVWIIGLDFKVS